MNIRTDELSMFKGDDLAKSVWKSKYALENETHYDQMHYRLASRFYEVEKKYQEDEQLDSKKDNKNNLSYYGKIRRDLSLDNIYTLLKDFKYVILQGSVMSMLGNKAIGSLSNCFVVGQPKDSYGGIFEKDEEMAQLMKRRGGVGIDISTLRPESAKTNNAANTSTGAVSFMHRFSNTTREVAQNGRRGALMISMDINHPDILEFIKIKRDLSQVTGANISIKLNDKFMKAVENDDDYILRFPCTQDISYFTDDYIKAPYNKLHCIEDHTNDNSPIYIRKIKAKEYWDEIIKSAHNVAEPGLMFWDTMVDYSPDGVYPQFKQVTTNPCCFSKNSRVDVVTKNGIKDIKEVTSKDLVWLENEHKFVPTKGYTNYGEAETYTVKFSNGEEFNVTNNHKFAKIKSKRVGSKLNKENFELIELKDLKIGDEIRVHNSKSLSFGEKGNKEEGQILGWLSGDGCLSYTNADDNIPTMYLDFWKKEYNVGEELLSYINSLNFNNTMLEFKNNGNTVKRIASSRIVQHFIEKFELNLWKFRTGRNEFLYEASQEFVQGYLSAYFTADGTVQNVDEQSRFSVSLASIDLDRLNQVQSLLLNFGIKSSIGLVRKTGTNNDYSYENSKDCYRLTITGITNIKLFKEYIGFMNVSKQIILDEICNKEYKYEKSLDYTKIVSIEYNGKEEVGCIEVPNYHYFTANSIISGNSEIAMQPYDACRLIAVNLFSFVVDPFKDTSYFNFDKFYRYNYEAMRLSDDLIDLELDHIDAILDKIVKDSEPYDIKHREYSLWLKIRDTAKSSRRTGLGFTALGDCLAALGIKYDSEEALIKIKDIMKTKMISELDCTIDLAILRGTFDGWDVNLEYPESEDDNKLYGNDFYYKMQVMFPDQVKRMQKWGRRNVSISTVAPTGSVSILTQTTSGIEPLFQPFYTRRKKVNPGEASKVDFVDQNGDSWQEYPVLHAKFKDWIKIHNSTYTDDSINLLSSKELEDLFALSPWYKSIANDINGSKRIEIQSIIQQYITHSISSTINLPNNVTEAEVSNIYKESWKKGLKGITVYRDGSRSGVLVSNPTEPKHISFEYNSALKRPKEVQCFVHTSKVKGIEYKIIVGLIDNRPYEVFIHQGIAYGNGVVRKKSKGNYVFIKKDTNESFQEDITAHVTPEQEAIARLISWGLRHGGGVLHCVEVLKKIDSIIYDFIPAVTRTLKKYIEAEDAASLKCDICGATSIIFEEGCSKCLNCGNSKCS